MNIIKQEIIENICYTELVYERINKKLNVKLSKKQIEKFILKTLKETGEFFFKKMEKTFMLRMQSIMLELQLILILLEL